MSAENLPPIPEQKYMPDNMRIVLSQNYDCSWKVEVNDGYKPLEPAMQFNTLERAVAEVMLLTERYDVPR